LSDVCSNGNCQQSTCQDGKWNGAEEGVDCGGSCDKCAGYVSNSNARYQFYTNPNDLRLFLYSDHEAHVFYSAVKDADGMPQAIHTIQVESRTPPARNATLFFKKLDFSPTIATTLKLLTRVVALGCNFKLKWTASNNLLYVDISVRSPSGLLHFDIPPFSVPVPHVTDPFPVASFDLPQTYMNFDSAVQFVVPSGDDPEVDSFVAVQLLVNQNGKHWVSNQQTVIPLDLGDGTFAVLLPSDLTPTDPDWLNSYQRFSVFQLNRASIHLADLEVSLNSLCDRIAQILTFSFPSSALQEEKDIVLQSCEILQWSLRKANSPIHPEQLLQVNNPTTWNTIVAGSVSFETYSVSPGNHYFVHLLLPNNPQSLTRMGAIGQPINNLQIPIPGPPLRNGCEAVQAGNDYPSTEVFDLKRKRGTFSFSWETYSIPDQIDVFYQGAILFTSGCVGANSVEKLRFNGVSSSITVQVTPNCQGTTGTAWEYGVKCLDSYLSCKDGKCQCTDGTLTWDSTQNRQPTQNGCGSDNSKIGLLPQRIVDKYPFGNDFRACCNTHDICYGTCNSERANCDLAMANCLSAVCPNYPDYSHLCPLYRDTFSRAVSWGGKNAFYAAQEEECVCN
jgi:hypothetical protein